MPWARSMAACRSMSTCGCRTEASGGDFLRGRAVPGRCAFWPVKGCGWTFDGAQYLAVLVPIKDGRIRSALVDDSHREAA